MTGAVVSKVAEPLFAYADVFPATSVAFTVYATVLSAVALEVSAALR